MKRMVLGVAALMAATIVAANAMAYVAPSAPPARTGFHLAAFKNAGGCTSEAQAHCAGDPNPDVCIAAYRRAHHC